MAKTDVPERMNEPPFLFTRADAVAALGALALAGGSLVWCWGRLGVSPEVDPSLDASTGAGFTAGAGSSAVDGAGSSDTAESSPAGTDGVAAGTPGAGLYAVIQNAAGLRKVLPLWQDGEYRAESDLGYNIIEVKDGRVHVKESDCKNQVCVQSGWSSIDGQLITCLPHRLVIEVVTSEDEASTL